MKDMRGAFRSVLLADDDVSVLVAASRIFPTIMPQGEKLPSIVYRMVTEAGDYHMQGDSGLSNSRMQVDSWAIRLGLAEELSVAAHNALSGFRGVQDDIEFQGMFLAGGREDFDGTAGLYRVSRDYFVWYRAAPLFIATEAGDPLQTEAGDFIVMEQD